ncbi:Glutamate or tyrosine decarboxylase [Streptomyces sp. DI166]|uniref:pyridoxal phosphate-dependent decarboxylase family protein n=1 Tax=Streptomyces sp. DI166 TaxID=1839783 RepID=UPI0007F35810|nr:aminotransferase class V-fold PLP-dependent enzyme [Streptomyces sp. DI166]SBT93047.1 Glutamate or tyrosine decarboxylase [Streptomyces sp. DI166]
MNTPPPALGPLLAVVLDALTTGTRARGGPLPPGGPEAVAARLREAVGAILPEKGDANALHTLTRALTEGSADPTHPHCTAHLHCPPLPEAVAADLATNTLNQSLDSWDQSPAASTLESLLTRQLAALTFPPAAAADTAAPAAGATEATSATAAQAAGAAEATAAQAAEAESADTAVQTAGSRAAGAARAGAGGAPRARVGEPTPTVTPSHGTAPHAPGTHTDGTDTDGTHTDGTDPGDTAPDALVTTGGTESNQLALLLAREAHPGTRLIHGANAHHSLPRAAWLLGMPDPVVVPAPAGTLDPAALDEALTHLPGPHLVAATAGTTDAGLIDPLPEIARLCEQHHARLHIDAAYGGGLLFSDRHRPKLAGLASAATVTLDLHKLGWQPIAAGILAVRDPHDLAALHHRADYLNADDDTEAGIPDLLGRSLRTTRRADALKIAVTLKTLGRTGIGSLVDQVCARAEEFAEMIDHHPRFELYDRPTISTVLFRPRTATDDTVAAVRRTLLTDGRAVLGRARLDGRLWLKATLLNPHTGTGDLAALLHLVEGTTPR